MKIIEPFKSLTKFELMLWLSSVIIVTASFLIAGQFNPLTLIASLVGVTALIFIAKGFVIGQALIIIFSIIYAVISLQYHYYGEMITYMFMSAPIAGMTAVSWLKHPYKDTSEVTISKLTKAQKLWMIVLTIVATVIFFFILRAFNTPNLALSTVSIATSFSAAYLMLFRSPLYALAYASNDLVLVVLWILASVENPSYIPVVVCFAIFFFNDIYGFINWKRMKVRQSVSNII